MSPLPPVQRTLADRKLKPITDYTWPVTWRYEMVAPWGRTQLELSADVPMLADDGDASILFGRALWQLAIAPAICQQVELALVWTATWRNVSVPLPVPVVGFNGHRPGLLTSRADAGQLVLHTGHTDKLAQRRLLLPGIPRGWVDDGLLTPIGMESLVTHARGMYMGLQNISPNARCRWLIAYRYSTLWDIGNPYGVSLREVASVRVAHHTDKAPEHTGVLWP